MMRPLASALALALVVTGCVDEDPTDVGDALVTGSDVLTFEVVLPASQFLVFDSAFSGFLKPIEANFAVIANDFATVVDANTLFRFSLPPRTISVRTTGTTMVVDSMPRFVSGSLVIRLDTVTTTARPVGLRLFRTVEEWDASATWTNRVDTAGVRLAWSTPGGTRGIQIDSATWVDGDSVVFAVDSATLALWNDSTNQARGAILVSETSDSRVRVIGTVMHVAAKSALQPDTTVNVDLVPTIRTFVYDPVLTSPFSGIRAGGIESWRSFLRLRPDLRSLVLPCGTGPSGCSVPLDSVHVNTAQLLLRPVASPTGFSPEDSVFIEGRTLSLAPQVPLERSAIGDRTALSRLLAPDLFRTPAPTDVVALNITSFIVHLLDESVAEANRVPPVLAILQIPEGGTFGLASFAAEPALRLVLTTPLARSQ